MKASHMHAPLPNINGFETQSEVKFSEAEPFHVTWGYLQAEMPPLYE
jgi:hypothetical protein